MTGKNDYIPRDYEDLYRYYILGSGNGNSLCHQVIRSMLPYSDEDERETLAHDVWLRCRTKELLKIFDPEKANFGGAIFFVTRTIVVNHLNRKGRNPLTGLKAGTLTDLDPGEWTASPGVYHLDRLFATETPDPGERLDLLKLLKELRDRCAALKEKAHPTAYQATRDRSLLPLLELLIQECDPEECGTKLGVTASTIHNWLGIIRDMVEDIRNTVLAEKKRPLGPGKMLPVEEG